MNQIKVGVNKLFLQGPIKSLYHPVDPGTMGIGKVMFNPLFG